MTPEERIEIDKKLQALVEVQSKHDQRIRELAERTDARFAETEAQFARTNEEINERFKRTDQQIDKNTAAIRDLIAISRTLIDSQAALEDKMKNMAANVDRLNDVVQAFIKSLQKPSQLA